MAYKYYFGPSGSGKTYRINSDVIKNSLAEPDRQILVITPDQYTMQTQRDIVLSHERKGMMNIEVVSFSRLAASVFEEVGFKRKVVLDDTGKNLILRRLSIELKEELPYLGGNIDKQGYIHEIKSVISEFMQYGVSVNDVDELIKEAGEKKALKGRLIDIKKMYEAFMESLSDKYETKEERLTILAELIFKSEMIKDSLVVFDGFTGFTPIQGNVISSILNVAHEVWFGITIDRKALSSSHPENTLFNLSYKTINYINKLAKEAGVTKLEDVYLDDNENHRLTNNRELSFLEKHLFRNDRSRYDIEPDNISLKICDNPRQELQCVAKDIRKYIEEGHRYRDVAVITGDLERYASYVPEVFGMEKIPYFVDATRKLVLNPFTEHILCGLDVIVNDFSYASVMHFLRSGLVNISNEEIDSLDNYLLARGIKGASKWKKDFKYPASYMKEYVEGKLVKTSETEKELADVNVIREKVVEALKALVDIKPDKKYGALILCRKIYEFIEDSNVYERLCGYAELFEKLHDNARENEYNQVYQKVLEVFDQIAALLGDDELSIDEFIKILVAGIGEIKIGVLPPGMDYVPVGDIERSRLGNIKKLYFIGVNDGVIPKSESKGGLISDLDRDYFERKDINQELAPSPRQKMNYQKLYLYMNMTKPTEKLCISYSKKDATGKGIRPSYLIQDICSLYSKLNKEKYTDDINYEDVYSVSDCANVLADALREAVNSSGEDKLNEITRMMTLLKVIEKRDYHLAESILNGAFEQYDNAKKYIAEELVKALYGAVIKNSISRLERYAGCAFSHFLNYGMKLKEKETAGFNKLDVGNVIHEVLREYQCTLMDNGEEWKDAKEASVSAYVSGKLKEMLGDYKDNILENSYRDAYQFKRLERILTRTIMNMAYHLNKGLFKPKGVEVEFKGEVYAKGIDKKAFVEGRIDRIDTYEDDENVYVKVVDYKSGNKSLDTLKVYSGKQLQLIVYLDQAAKLEKKKKPGKSVIPSAVFYYYVHDPIISSDVNLDEEALGKKIIEDMKDTGVFVGEGEVAELLDRDVMDVMNTSKSSDVVNVSVKKGSEVILDKGDFVSREDMDTIIDYTRRKVVDIAQDMAMGNITPDYSDSKQCSYCSYKDICHRDSGSYTEPEKKYSYDEVIDMMKDTLKEMPEEKNNVETNNSDTKMNTAKLFEAKISEIKKAGE